MIKKYIFILNLSENNSLPNDKESLNQKIIYFSSLLHNSYLNLYPNCMIAIISIKNGLLTQISHFSGNKIHHNQGLLRLTKKHLNGKFGIKDAFFFAKKLFGKSEFFFKKEVILFTSENPNDPFHHIFGSFLKENYIFSVFLFGKRIFIFEILAKMTNGFCFFIGFKTSKLQKFLNYGERHEITTGNTFPTEISKIETKFFFNYINSKQKTVIFNRLKTFCDNCGFDEKKFKNFTCQNCFSLSIENLNSPLFYEKNDFMNNIFLNFAEKFSIFSLHFVRNRFLTCKIVRKKGFNNSWNCLYDFHKPFVHCKNDVDKVQSFNLNKRNNLFTIY